MEDFMPRRQLKSRSLILGFVLGTIGSTSAHAQNPAETSPPEHKRTDPQQANTPQQPAPAPKQPTAAELSAKDTPGAAMLRTFEYAEYEFRSAAEAMPPDKYDYRPTPGDYGGVYPGYGPK